MLPNMICSVMDQIMQDKVFYDIELCENSDIKER